MSKSSKCLNVKAYNLPGGRDRVPSANRESHCATTGFMLPKVLRRNTIRGRRYDGDRVLGDRSESATAVHIPTGGWVNASGLG